MKESAAMHRFHSQNVARRVISVFFPVLMALVAPHGLAQKTEGEAILVFSYPDTNPYNRENLYGFNHAPNVTTMPDGRLLAAWFSGPYEGSVHQVILGCTSEDGGKTWSKAEVMVDYPRECDFDPAFLHYGKTSWMFFSVGRWNRYPYAGRREKEAQNVGVKSFRTYAQKSEDSGRTWTKPVLISQPAVFCRANGIVLKSGVFLLPVYTDSPDEVTKASAVLRSEDKGETWTQSALVSSPELKSVNEPAVVELDNGAVLMSLRTRDGFLWTALSTDEGKTWAAPTNTGLEAAASSSSLFRTKSGRVFVTYDACKPPLRSPLVMRELNQKTMTWGNPLEIASIAPPKADSGPWSTQVCYPSVTELNDGTLLVVWTQIVLDTEDQHGKIYARRIKL